MKNLIVPVFLNYASIFLLLREVDPQGRCSTWCTVRTFAAVLRRSEFNLVAAIGFKVELARIAAATRVFLRNVECRILNVNIRIKQILNVHQGSVYPVPSTITNQHLFLRAPHGMMFWAHFRSCTGPFPCSFQLLGTGGPPQLHQGGKWYQH